jgi:hypothetical protein
MRAFLGLGIPFREMMRGCSDPGTRPTIRCCSRRAVECDSTWRCIAAFEALKHALLHAPVLTLPHFAADAWDSEVWCDGPGYGTGAVLMQAGQVIAYEARAAPGSIKAAVRAIYARARLYMNKCIALQHAASALAARPSWPTVGSRCCLLLVVMSGPSRRLTAATACAFATGLPDDSCSMAGRVEA